MGFFSNTKVKVSGTHTTIKKEMPIARVLSNVHPAQPQKGKQNPQHIQVNISKFYANLTKEK